MSSEAARPEGPAVVEIKVRENGPYRVEGPFRLLDADGNVYETERGALRRPPKRASELPAWREGRRRITAQPPIS